MRHTAGFTYGALGNTPADSAFRAADLYHRAPSLAEFVDRLARLPLVAQPGTEWIYGPRTDVLGRVVEIVSGISLDRFFRERIFAPLGMDDTFYEVPTDRRASLAGY